MIGDNGAGLMVCRKDAVYSLSLTARKNRFFNKRQGKAYKMYVCSAVRTPDKLARVFKAV